ncbi:MAG: hypothetical protein Q9162_002873 [Coniocarpon cinnabarinum]
MAFASSSRHHKSSASSHRDGNESKGIWSSLLDSVATGRRLAEKNLLVLGGTSELQKEFLDVIAEDNPQVRRGSDRAQKRQPPIANRFALGYTYQDLLDADQDEPLFTPESISNSLLVVLLDWSEPWNWARQLRDWVRILRMALSRLDRECFDAMDENMKMWKERRQVQNAESFSTAESDVSVTLGPGEWDEPLGVPICCVCQHAEKTDMLEREHGWKDDEFDYILQYMRTVLLKHGGSLVYTASSAPGQLHTLLRSSLGIHSLLQRNPLKYNVIDRDKIMVPPNWDSWGKIRPLSEKFDLEGLSNAWSIDVQPQAALARSSETARVSDMSQLSNLGESDTSQPDAVARYEQRIENPTAHQSSAMQFGSTRNDGVETYCQDTQDFLAGQLQVLDKLKAEDEREQKAKEAKRLAAGNSASNREAQTPTNSRVNEHLGPVQFNMGGIQVDADDALKNLKEHATSKSPDLASKASSPEPGLEPEKLSNFFAGLVSRGTSSATSSPRRDASAD